MSCCVILHEGHKIKIQIFFNVSPSLLFCQTVIGSIGNYSALIKKTTDVGLSIIIIYVDLFRCFSILQNVCFSLYSLNL